MATVTTWYYDLIVTSGEEQTTIITKGDTYIDSGNAGKPYGGATTIEVGKTAGGDTRRGLFQIKLPEQPENAGRIQSVGLYLYQESYTGTGGVVIMRECESDYVAGGVTDLTDDDYGATWNHFDGKTAWPGDAGDKTGNEIMAYVSTTSGADSTYIGLGNPGMVQRHNLTWGSTIDVVLRIDGEGAGEHVKFSSMETATAAQRPKIQITYEIDQPVIPDAEDEILTIEPNPNNPTQPLLKWKKPENQSLRIDNRGAYCLVRNEAIIDNITDGYLIAQLNQGEEYIDTAALTENNLYYYKLYFCSETDYIDNAAALPILMATVDAAGDIIGTPIASNQVWMIRPDVSTFTVLPVDPDVKEQVTGTITAVVAGDFASTPTPVQHTHYQFDWKGDSTESGWVELETPANTCIKTHYYLGYQAATAAKARIKNSLGFWSDATDSADVTVAAITAIPLINVSPKVMAHDTLDTGTATGAQTNNTLKDTNKAWTVNEYVGKTITIHLDGGQIYENRVISSNTADTITVAPNWTNNPVTTVTEYEIITVFSGVLRVLGDQSYARSSNETLTKYEFRVQRTSDAAYYDAAGPPYWVAGVTWNDLLTVPYMDITANNMGAEDTYTCLTRVTSSSFGVSTTDATTTMTVITTVPVDMKAILTNSVFKTYNMGSKRVKSRHRVIEGTTEIIIDSGREMPQIRIMGSSKGVNFQTDYNQLVTWKNDDTLLKIYTDPQATTPAKYIEGWIEDLIITKRQSMNIEWQCNFVSKSASL